jgi:hypothetical protein
MAKLTKKDMADMLHAQEMKRLRKKYKGRTIKLTTKLIVKHSATITD